MVKDYETMSDKEVQELRVAIRKRQNYKCLFCSSNLEEVGYANSVHHIVPRAFGGLLSLDNCICVCNRCHNKIEILNKRFLKGTCAILFKKYGLEGSSSSMKTRKLDKTNLFEESSVNADSTN